MRKFIIFLIVFISLTALANGSVSLKVGVYVNPPKFIFTKKGEIEGFWPEILNSIARKYGWQLQYIKMPFDSCLDALKKGEIDMLPDLAPSIERSKLFIFNGEPFFYNWGVIYRRPNIEIESFYDLKGKRIAVFKNSIHTAYIMDILDKLGIECDYYEVSSYIEVFRAISDGKADAGVVNRIFGQLEEDSFNVKRTGIVYNLTPVEIAFPKDFKKRDIITQINSEIRRMKKDENSIYYTLVDKYFAFAGKRNKHVFLRIEVINLIFNSLLVILVIFYVVRKGVTLRRISGARWLLAGIFSVLTGILLESIYFFVPHLYLGYVRDIFFSLGIIFLSIWAYIFHKWGQG